MPACLDHTCSLAFGVITDNSALMMSQDSTAAIIRNVLPDVEDGEILSVVDGIASSFGCGVGNGGGICYLGSRYVRR